MCSLVTCPRAAPRKALLFRLSEEDRLATLGPNGVAIFSRQSEAVESEFVNLVKFWDMYRDATDMPLNGEEADHYLEHWVVILRMQRRLRAKLARRRKATQRSAAASTVMGARSPFMMGL